MYNKSNPCLCGYYGDPFKECRCSSGEISRYHKRISGPLLDRIDIFIEVPHIDYENLKVISEALGHSSAALTSRAALTPPTASALLDPCPNLNGDVAMYEVSRSPGTDWGFCCVEVLTPVTY